MRVANSPAVAPVLSAVAFQCKSFYLKDLPHQKGLAGLVCEWRNWEGAMTPESIHWEAHQLSHVPRENFLFFPEAHNPFLV